MNELQETKQGTTLQVSKEQQTLMPIAESYIAMFPNKENDTTKQNIISMALKLSETKDKTGRPAIDVCTKESIMQVAQEVIVKKLDLMKNQGALIVRGDKLMLQSQYQGNVARALELNPFLSHFNFVPIYKNDKVEMEIGKDGSYGIKNHSTCFSHIGNDNIVGGYVRAIKKDGSVYVTEVMTMEQIKIAWSKSSNASLSVHKQFPIKMVRKTILNSLCSWLINTTGEQEEYEEMGVSNSLDKDMELIIDDTQEFSEPTEMEEVSFVEEEPTQEDYVEAMEELQDSNEQVVTYAKWLNELKGNGWEMVQNSYDRVNKTVKVRKC